VLDNLDTQGIKSWKSWIRFTVENGSFKGAIYLVTTLLSV